MGSPAKRGRRVSEAEFRRLWENEATTIAEIGAYLGISRQAVRFRALRRGLPPRRAGPKISYNKKHEPVFVAMYQAGLSRDDIASVLGFSPWSVADIARRLGLQPRARTWRAKTTLAQYREQQIASQMLTVAKAEVAAMRSANQRMEGLAA
jgi:hypothetical protein